MVSSFMADQAQMETPLQLSKGQTTADPSSSIGRNYSRTLKNLFFSTQERGKRILSVLLIDVLTFEAIKIFQGLSTKFKKYFRFLEAEMPTLKLRIGLPSKRALGSICICGALASISGLAYMRWRLEDQVRRTEYYQMAIQQLRQHSGAVSLLGEPIRESGFNVSNEKNRVDGERAQLQVTVQGSKDKGTVYFWATNSPKKGWLIERLELETQQHPNTRFLLKKPTTLSQVSADNDPEPQESEEAEQVPQEKIEVQDEPDASREQNADRPPPSIQNNPPQQLHQQQGQEPAPYIQTVEGGRMQ